MPSRCWILVATLAVAGACGRPDAEGPRVGGVVTLRHDVPLPPAARLVVALADVTPPEPVILVEDTLADLSAPPIPFELPYDTSGIDTSHVYAVAARIVLGSDVMFASPVSHEVITHGNPLRVEIPLEPASVMGPLPARAADIAARLSTMERIDGSRRDESGASAISAYFDDGVLRYLEERITIGAYGSAVNAYYFDEGALFYLESIKQLRENPADTTVPGDEVAFRALFAPDGTVAGSSKWVNGEPGPLDEAELRTALRHAVVLRESALQLAADTT